jgi:hypothetical protein
VTEFPIYRLSRKNVTRNVSGIDRSGRLRPLYVSDLPAVGRKSPLCVPCTNTKLRPRKDHRAVDLISEALPFDRLWYGEPNGVSNAVGYAKFFSRSHDAVIRVYDEAGNVIETHGHKGEFREP